MIVLVSAKIHLVEDEDLFGNLEGILECYELHSLCKDESDNQKDINIPLPVVISPTTEQRRSKKIKGGFFDNNELKSIFNQENYRSRAGIINYITIKGRIDIQVYANILAQFSTMPSILEIEQAVHLFQYCYSNKMVLKLKFDITNDSEIMVDVYTDSSDKRMRPKLVI